MKYLADEIKEALDVAEKKILDLELLADKLFDAISYLEKNGRVTPVELAQLGVGKLTRDMNGDEVGFTRYSLDDLSDRLKSGDGGRATAAKFRILKSEFQAHQKAVSAILIDARRLTKKNVLSTRDMIDFFAFVDGLSNLIGRDLGGGDL